MLASAAMHLQKAASGDSGLNARAICSGERTQHQAGLARGRLLGGSQRAADRSRLPFANTRVIAHQCIRYPRLVRSLRHYAASSTQLSGRRI